MVYVPLEGRAAAVSRLLAWKALHRIPQTLAIGVHFYAGDLQLDSASALGRLVAAAKPIRPRLVVIDTLSRASAGLDENSPEMNRAIAGLDRLRAALGCAVLVLHHTGKSGATERGHSVIRGAIDALWLMSLADDVITISCAKARNAEPFDPIPLRRIVSPAGVVLELASAVLPAEELSPTQRRILDTIEGSFGDGGATVRDLQDVLPEIPRPSLYRALKTLTDNGHLVHAGPRMRCGNGSGSGGRIVSRGLTFRPSESHGKSQSLTAVSRGRLRRLGAVSRGVSRESVPSHARLTQKPVSVSLSGSLL